MPAHATIGLESVTSALSVHAMQSFTRAVNDSNRLPPQYCHRNNFNNFFDTRNKSGYNRETTYLSYRSNLRITEGACEI